VPIEEQDMLTIVGEVWNGWVGLDTWPAIDTNAGVEGPVLDGRIEIEGAWTGAVVVRCPTSLAHRAATKLLGVEPSSPDEVIDVVGEITNQTGANIKAVLPGPSTLSLPTVMPRQQGDTDLGGEVLCQFAFACEGDLFIVAVLTAGDTGPSAATAATTEGAQTR
jgi:chemotaxis protein CheX